jgi:hypothetical protein
MSTAIDSLRGILNGFRDLNSKGIYTMNATEADLLRQILLEVQALSLGGGLADGSVTTPKIADLNVTTSKFADLSVTTPKLADNSATTAKIPDANITAPKLSGAQTGSAPIFGVRAWVNFNGTGTVAIRASGNVSSITDNGNGDYTINFTTALPNANYAVSVVSTNLLAGNQDLIGVVMGTASGGATLKTTTQLRINIGNITSVTLSDASEISVIVVG